MKKRILAFTLAILLILSLMPTMAFAEDYVAMIGTTGYTEIYDAFVAAVNGDTIKVVGNPGFHDAFSCPFTNKNITFDLSGVTISTDDTLFVSEGNGTLTIIDSVGGGKLSSSMGVVAFAGDGNSVKFNGGTVEDTSGYGIIQLWGAANTTVEVNGATVVGAENPKGDINGVTASGNLIVNCDAWNPETPSSGTKLDITGGTFPNNNVSNILSSVEDIDISISGGTFAKQPDSELIENGAVFTVGETTYTKGTDGNITPNDPGGNPGDDPGDDPGDNPGDNPGDDPGDDPGTTVVAKIGEAEYTSLAAAIVAAADNDTIVVQANCKVNAVEIKNKKFTLDLNNFTVSGPVEGFTFALTGNTDITVIDSGDNGTIIGPSCFWITGDANKLYLKSGTLQDTSFYGAIQLDGATNTVVEVDGAAVKGCQDNQTDPPYGGTCFYEIASGKTSENNVITVKSGTINSLGKDPFKLLEDEGTTAEIRGGEFDTEEYVEEYLADDCEIGENGEIIDITAEKAKVAEELAALATSEEAKAVLAAALAEDGAIGSAATYAEVLAAKETVKAAIQTANELAAAKAAALVELKKLTAVSDEGKQILANAEAAIKSAATKDVLQGILNGAAADAKAADDALAAAKTAAIAEIEAAASKGSSDEVAKLLADAKAAIEKATSISAVKKASENGVASIKKQIEADNTPASAGIFQQIINLILANNTAESMKEIAILTFIMNMISLFTSFFK